jgi:RNA repair pathway DNA polymerase beta family
MIDVFPHKLVYLAKSGSHLFGTATPKSDLDVKGLFLPSRSSLYLQNAPQQFSMNTNTSNAKNSSDDVDVTVWSVQFWLKLLTKGDINAVSLLFSYTNPDAMLEGTDAGFLERLKALDPSKLLSRNLSGMMGFAYNQAIKYTAKGKHLHAVQIAISVLTQASQGLISDVADVIVMQVADESMARVQVGSKGIKQLVLLEKMFDFTASTAWALAPLHEVEARYGKRAKLALEAGVDFKAFSHSLRVLEEIRLLHSTGRISYPHTGEFAKLMMDAKMGILEYEVLVEQLDRKLEEARASEASSVLPSELDPSYSEAFLLSLYEV